MIRFVLSTTLLLPTMGLAMSSNADSAGNKVTMAYESGQIIGSEHDFVAEPFQNLIDDFMETVPPSIVPDREVTPFKFKVTPYEGLLGAGKSEEREHAWMQCIRKKGDETFNNITCSLQMWVKKCSFIGCVETEFQYANAHGYPNYISMKNVTTRVIDPGAWVDKILSIRARAKKTILGDWDQSKPIVTWHSSQLDFQDEELWVTGFTRDRETLGVKEKRELKSTGLKEVCGMIEAGCAVVAKNPRGQVVCWGLGRACDAWYDHLEEEERKKQEEEKRIQEENARKNAEARERFEEARQNDKIAWESGSCRKCFAEELYVRFD